MSNDTLSAGLPPPGAFCRTCPYPDRAAIVWTVFPRPRNSTAQTASLLEGYRADSALLVSCDHHHVAVPAGHGHADVIVLAMQQHVD
jgi:hypothetical protein